MKIPREYWVPFACSCAIPFALIVVLKLIAEAVPNRPSDMRTVERLLVNHGLPVEGFAATPAVNLDAIDAMAPAECAEILRKTYLAKLAVIRMAPERAADARGIANAVRFTLAADAGTPECAP